MSTTVETLLTLPPEFRSAEVAVLYAGLEDQTRRVVEATRGLTIEQLGWQSGPGVNTIGMLIAHIAIAEVHIVDVGVAGLEDSRVREVLGISMEDDGLPLPPEGSPPAALAGKDVAFFHDLLARARRHCLAIARVVTDADLTRRITRPRADGGTRVLDVRWALYHLLEHEASHLGQIQMLVHLEQSRRAAAVPRPT